MEHRITSRTQVTLVLTMTPHEAEEILLALDRIDKPVAEGRSTNFTYQTRVLYGALKEVAAVPDKPGDPS